MGCIYTKPICIPNNSPKVYVPLPLNNINNINNNNINNNNIIYNNNPVTIN